MGGKGRQRELVLVLYLNAGTRIRIPLTAEMGMGWLKGAMRGVKAFLVVGKDNNGGCRQRRRRR